MHALLDAVVGALGHAQQLDAEAEFVGGEEIGERDGFDAFHRNGAGVDAAAEGERGENGQFVGGVEAADVEGRVGLGIAQALRFGEAELERHPFGLHARQDVVAGAVENAADARDRIARQPFAQGLDDRHAAADRRFIGERDAAALGQLRQFDAMRRQHRLVRGDDMQPASERGFHRLEGGTVGAADQFHEKIDLAALGQLNGIGKERRGLQAEAPVAVRARAHRGDGDVPARADAQVRRDAAKLRHKRGADDAESGEADSEGFGGGRHRFHPFSARAPNGHAAAARHRGTNPGVSPSAPRRSSS